MTKTAILIGTTTGNTASAAKQIAAKLGEETKVFNVANVDVSEFSEYQNLILGTSTWGIGDLQDDWDAFLNDFSALNLDGKTIAFFGLGDAQGYYDSFVDGMGIIYDGIKDKACTVVGQVDTEAYDFGESRAVIDGQFIGLPLDEDNESNLSAERINNWVELIKPAMS